MKALCKLGIHKWKEYERDKHTILPAKWRKCVMCGKLQALMFYSNRTQKWETIKKPKQ